MIDEVVHQILDALGLAAYVGSNRTWLGENGDLEIILVAAYSVLDGFTIRGGRGSAPLAFCQFPRDIFGPMKVSG